MASMGWMMSMATLASNRLGALGINLALNIALPAVILLRLSDESRLGPVPALMLALAFPIGFGMYDLVWRGQYNAFSVLGLLGVALTGGIGILQLDAGWVAVKEASVPLLLGAAVIISRATPYPLVSTLLAAAINFDRVNEALHERGTVGMFERRMKVVTYLVAGSFLLSAALNYVLARLVVTSEVGTVSFNEELGRLTYLSYPIIALPSLLVLWCAVVWLVLGIHEWSGLTVRQIFR
jgi:hypothetical protein